MPKTTRTRGHAMVYSMMPNRATARDVARAVLEKRLAASANLIPAESLYRWHGAIEEATEIAVIFKTRASRVRQLIGEVRRLHPYDVPCIVSVAMGTALDTYLDWIDAETTVQR